MCIVVEDSFLIRLKEEYKRLINEKNSEMYVLMRPDKYTLQNKQR